MSRRDALRVMGGGLALAMAGGAGAAMSGLFSEPTPAYAALTPDSVTLIHPDKDSGSSLVTNAPVANIGVMGTGYLRACDNNRKQNGSCYCVSPGYANPMWMIDPNHVYPMTFTPTSKYKLTPIVTHTRMFSVSDVETFLWFAVDGLGFDSSMWPKSYGGTTFVKDHLYWLCHFMATYLIWGDVASPHHHSWSNGMVWREQNSSEVARTHELWNWMRSDILSTTNPNSVLYKMFARRDEVKGGFQTYMIDGEVAGDDTQDIIGCLWELKSGYLKIRKDSTE